MDYTVNVKYRQHQPVRSHCVLGIPRFLDDCDLTDDDWDAVGACLDNAGRAGILYLWVSGPILRRPFAQGGGVLNPDGRFSLNYSISTSFTPL